MTAPKQTLYGVLISVLALVLASVAILPADASPDQIVALDALPVVAGRAVGLPEGSVIQVLFSPEHTDEEGSEAVPGDVIELPPVALESVGEGGYFGLYPSKTLPLADLPMDVTILVYGKDAVYPYNIVLQAPTVDEASGAAIIPTLEIDAAQGDRAAFRYSDRRLTQHQMRLNEGGRISPSKVLLTPSSSMNNGLVPTEEARKRQDVGLRVSLVEESVQGAPVSTQRLTQLRTAAEGSGDILAMATLTREYMGRAGDFRTIMQTTGTNSSWVSYEYQFNRNNSSGDSFEVGVGFSQGGSQGSFSSAGRMTRSSSVSAEFNARRTVGRYHMYGKVRYGRYRLRDIATGAVYGYELRARGVPGDFWRSFRLSNSYPKYCTILGAGVRISRTSASTVHYSNGVNIGGWGSSLQVLQTLTGGSTHRVSFVNHASSTNKYVCGSRTVIGDLSRRAGLLMGDYKNR